MKIRVICGELKTKSEMEKLIIAGREFNSRLFLGTGKFNSNELMEQSILASGTEMVTVAMKRIDMENSEDDMLKHIVHPHIQLLPNTSGVRNAEEAVFAGQMAREAFGTNWLKLEIHPDPRYLLPDSVETLKATERLVKLGFVVLPYCQADPVLCKQLEEAGAATVMPLGAPIGTNKGLQTKEFIHIIHPGWFHQHPVITAHSHRDQFGAKSPPVCFPVASTGDHLQFTLIPHQFL